MRPSLPHALLCAAVVLAGRPDGAAQEPGSPSRSGPRTPVRDPVTVRGCIEKRSLRILEHDVTDLSGVTRVRLKASRSMQALLDEARGRHLEITGDLDLGRHDRLETRRKYKVGAKTTVSIGASAEQVRGADATAPDATLVVSAFTILGDRCPSR